ncbi:MAG: hypothetical protein IKA36_04045 [Clostridia bacterium]|nr:hypothetical protein [Clostridia bacterium]
MELYTIRLTQDPIKCRELLDNMILDTLREWTIFNITSEESSYMNETNQQEAVKYIVSTIISRSTETIKDQLKVGYPFNDDTELAKIITPRAVMAVLNYSIKQNTMDMSTVNLPNSLF